MRLRAKIFLFVGGLFFFAFIASQVLEEYLTSANLKFEGASIRSKLIEHEEARRQEIELFAKSLIDRRFDQINVLFTKIKQYSWLRAQFTPNLVNYDFETWLASSTLLFDNKWIDLIENTISGEVASMIVLDDRRPSYAVKVEHDRHFSYIMTKDNAQDPDWEGPYIGIPYMLDLVSLDPKMTRSLSSKKNEGFQEEFYFLFDPDIILSMDTHAARKIIDTLDISNLSGNLRLADAKQIKHLLYEMVNHIEHAKKYFRQHNEVYNKITGKSKSTWIQQEVAKVNENCSKVSNEMNSLSNVSWSSLRFDKISMIWQITSILSTKVFGKEPFSKEFPIGIVQILPNMVCGQSVLNSEVFYDQLQTASRKSVSESTLYGGDEQYLQVIFQDTDERLFFGNTMYIDHLSGTNDLQHGTLTVAVDAREVVKDIAIATATDTFFVVNNKALKGFNGEGQELYGPQLHLPMDKINKKDSGFFTQNEMEYFYLKITPYQGLQFDFYLIVPKHKEFALSLAINDNAKLLIRKIAIQMQFIALAALLIVLFSLNHITRHVTEPITHLARACRILGHGRLDEVHLPQMKKVKKDEVYTLYHSFGEMIKGLKEKEKVQGVLNKVVSPKIAQEILKGNIHLGGEEKVVTVLFADIRHFTKISERMDPRDLINMLNTCMTKISTVIDSFGGVIDKYVGDEVMALFGAPIEDEQAAVHAVACGFEILRVLDDWNVQRAKQHLPIIEMGIGIHSGKVIVGNMGAENRLNYTVLGANVNLASRLCSTAKPSEILISQMTLNSLNVKETFETRSLDKMILKGFSEPIEVIEVVRPYELKPKDN
ncbi:MAG: adenylate/guanylate cyclase domain-containing protein [Rhabdochlamydiaceae bacterium]|nr:adenylate/guanylate cyclase domain-containing protein [Candidatus Amphrikana amoebophyrae]